MSTFFSKEAVYLIRIVPEICKFFNIGGRCVDFAILSMEGLACVPSEGLARVVSEVICCPQTEAEMNNRNMDMVSRFSFLIYLIFVSER